MNQQFSGKLPAAMVMPFAYFIPFAETVAGGLIVLGLFSRVGLTLSGVLLIGLTFGLVILGQAPTVAHNLQFVLINFVLLWFVEFNGFSLDALIWKKLTKSKPLRRSMARCACATGLSSTSILWAIKSNRSSHRQDNHMIEVNTL